MRSSINDNLCVKSCENDNKYYKGFDDWYCTNYSHCDDLV